MRDTLVQEIGLELIGSIVGACVGGFAGFYVLWPIITPLNLDYGVDVCAYGAMFLGAPAGSLVAISLVQKMIRRFHQCTCRAIIFALVACDVAIVLAKLLVGDSGIASGPGHLALIAGVSAFLGYRASGRTKKGAEKNGASPQNKRRRTGPALKIKDSEKREGESPIVAK